MRNGRAQKLPRIDLDLAIGVRASQQDPQNPNRPPSKNLWDEQSWMKGCGPGDREVKYEADTDKKNRPRGEVLADKALIYVVRSGRAALKVQTKLAVDGIWKGVNRTKNYFFFHVEPGEHYFCSRAENRSVVLATVEAGKTYYLGQYIYPGMWKARTELILLSEEEGLKEMQDVNLATWRVK